MEITVYKSTAHCAWKQYRKYRISLLMPKYTDLRDGTTRPRLHFTTILIFNIIKDSTYFCLTFLQILLIYVIIPVVYIQDLLEQNYAEFFLG